MGVSNRDRHIFKMCQETNEPAFVLRAQDQFLPQVLKGYKALLEADGGSEEMVAAVDARLDEVERWQTRYEDRVKVPDLREGEYEPKR